MRSFFLALLLLFCAPAGAQSAEELSEALALYAQEPKRARDELSELVRGDPEGWTPRLVASLDRRGLPNLFYFDAARLVSVFGSSKEQLDRAALALQREADFKRWDRSEWLFVCQKIATRGADARPCARRLLDEERFFIALFGGEDVLGKDYALVFLLLSMPETLWNREMGDRLWVGRDGESSQSALLSALFYTVSLRNDAILVKYSDDPSRPASGRARANALLGQMSAMESALEPQKVAQVRAGLRVPAEWGEMDLRQRRREVMSQVSRSALVDLERYTYLIRAEAAKRWRPRAPDARPQR